MAFRVNKNILIGVIVFVVLIVAAFAGYFIASRTSQPEEVTPEEGEAAEPIAGVGGICHPDDHTIYGITFSATHQDVDDETIKICTTLTHTGEGPQGPDNEEVTGLSRYEVYHCPTRGTSYCNEQGGQQGGCADNGMNGTDIRFGIPVCKEISKEEECGIVQWDIWASGKDGYVFPYFGYIYYFGTMDCPEIETNTDSSCTGMTSSPQASSGVITVSSASDSISVTATGADDDGTVSSLDICYAVGGQDSTYYQGGSSVFTCETTVDAQGSFSITHPYEYYTTNVANPNGLDVDSIVFSTNIYDVPDGAQFCSSNPGFNTSCTGKMIGKDGCTGADCDSCDLGTNCCMLQATLEEEEVIPGWEIDKEGVVTCYEEGTTSVYAQVEYTIVFDSETGLEDLLYVKDEYDSAIEDSWIVTTFPSATSIGGGIIRWDYDPGEEGIIGGIPDVPANEYRYTVRVPASMFGQLITNTASVVLSTGEEVQVSENVAVTCEGAGPTALPGTGIFDRTAARVALGVLLIGMAYAYYKFGLFDGAVEFVSEGQSRLREGIRFAMSREGQRDRYERKVVRRVKRKRRE